MTLAVMLTSERLAADSADEGSLVSMRAKMRAQVVGSGKTLRAKVALKGGRVFLLSAAVCAVRRRPFRVGKIKYVVALVGGVAGAAVA